MSENKISLRNEIPDSDKWDLSGLFLDIDNWEELFKSIESKISEYDKYFLILISDYFFVNK